MYRFMFLIYSSLLIISRFIIAAEYSYSAVEIKEPVFIFDSTQNIDISSHIKKLAEYESPLTNFLSYHGDPTSSDHSAPIKNLAFMNFITVLDNGDILDCGTGGKSTEGKIIVFESGEGSWLKNIKKLAEKRKNIYNTLELTSIFDDYDLDLSPQFIKESEDNPEPHQQIFDHFNLFWGDKISKDIIDENFLSTKSEFSRPINELAVPVKEKENVYNKIESVQNFIENVKQELELLDLTIIPAEDSSSLLSSTLNTYLKMTSSLESIQKTVKESEKELKLLSQMINKTKNRLCGEQKAARYIANNMNNILEYLRTSIPEGRTPKIVFLLLHSYQDPCPTCRFTFRRLSKYFLKNFLQTILPNTKFHIVASYRENFPDGRKDFPIIMDNENVISLSENSHDYISLFKIDKAYPPIIKNNKAVSTSTQEEKEIMGLNDSFLHPSDY